MIRVIIVVFLTTIGSLLGALAFYYETDIRKEISIQPFGIAKQRDGNNITVIFKFLNAVNANINAETFIYLETSKPKTGLSIQQKTMLSAKHLNGTSTDDFLYFYTASNELDIFDDILFVRYCFRFRGPLKFDAYALEGQGYLLREPIERSDGRTFAGAASRLVHPSIVVITSFDRRVIFSAPCRNQTLIHDGTFEF
jgi:hypothetical protein